jgi:arginase
VPVPLVPERVMLAGLGRLSDQEAAFIERLNLRCASAAELAQGNGAVLDWIAETGIEHLAIHLDLDVLDPTLFRALGFAKPKTDPAVAATLRNGAMNFDEIVGLIADVSARTDVVALGITEHLPWDAVNLQNMLRRIPILAG